jgi:hypothetical protein
MASDLNWVKDALEIYPISAWFDELCSKFHEQHIATGGVSEVQGAEMVAASEAEIALTRKVEALLPDSGPETSEDKLPKWMTSSQNDRLITRLCMGGNYLFSLS